MALVPYVTATLTANGGTNGVVTIGSTQEFRKGARVALHNSTPLTSEAIIIDITGYTTLVVKLLPTGPNNRYLNGVNPSDVSAFTTSLSSTITQSNEDVGDAELGRVLWALDGKGSGSPVSGASVNNTTVLGEVGWQLNILTQIILNTSSVDASVAVTAGYYFMYVSGQPAAINWNAAAVLATNAIIPVGQVSSRPIWLTNGTLHAIVSSGNGQVALVGAVPVSIY